MWDPPTTALVAAGRQVVRCDLRGYGFTPLEPGATYGDARDVMALVHDLGLTSFALVGASYGGHVPQQVATAVPDLVERMVLVCATGDLVEPDAGLRAFGVGRVDSSMQVMSTTTTRPGPWSGPCSARPSTSSWPRVRSTTANCR